MTGQCFRKHHGRDKFNDGVMLLFGLPWDVGTDTEGAMESRKPNTQPESTATHVK